MEQPMHKKSFVTALAVPFLFGACDTVSGPVTDGAVVGLSFAVTSHASAGSAGMAYALSADDQAGAALVIDRVQMVLAEIELERAGPTGNCDDYPELCEDFEAGPVLIDLPLDGGIITPFSTVIPEGSYDELEMEIEAPDGSDSVTLAFLGGDRSES
jgi:hypothetical protein